MAARRHSNVLVRIGIGIGIGIGGFIAIGLPLHAAIEFPSAQWATTWSEVWNWLRRQRVPGGSRAPEQPNASSLCAIVPGSLVDSETAETQGIKVWSADPVFVWQNTQATLQVKHSRTHEVMLTQALEPDQRSLVYANIAAAKPLQPGQPYYWVLSDDSASFVKVEVPFTMMNDAERADIQDQLELRLENIEDADDRLRMRVQFFIEQKLTADAFRELYTATTLPDDLQALKDDLATTNFCEQEPETVTLAPH